MEAMNINTYKRGVDRENNYRLLNEPVQLKMRTFVQAGLVQFPVKEESVARLIKQRLGIRGARKQTAARAARPVESIRIARVVEPAPVEVVGVRLSGGSAADEEVAALEARIKVLLGLVRK